LKGRFQLKRRDLYVALTLLLALGISAGLLRLAGSASNVSTNASKPQPAASASAKSNVIAKVESMEGRTEAKIDDFSQRLMMPMRGENVKGESEKLQQLSDYWQTRVTYPTGNYNAAWLQSAAQADRRMENRVPAGRVTYSPSADAPAALDPNRWNLIGPVSTQSDGCYGCFNYGPVSGRVDDIAIDPVSQNVAYIATVGGGVWKTTNCCNPQTSWVSTIDDPAINEVGISDLAIDPNNHNTVYAGTGEHSIATFGMGSYGLLKTTNAGASWTAKATDVFSNAYTPPVPSSFPQYQAILKVAVDPRNGNNVLVGTRYGVYVSYDGAETFPAGACLPGGFVGQHYEVTGLLARNTGTNTELTVAIGNPGLPTSRFPGRDLNGANGIYTATLGTSGCPATWNLISRPDNGWPAGTGSGIPHNLPGGNQLGRIDIDRAPSNPNYIYAQVQNPNSQPSCGATGCQLGIWRSTDGGQTWTQMSDGDALNDTCGFDYNQN